jgi:hypothetical protein
MALFDLRRRSGSIARRAAPTNGFKAKSAAHPDV